MISIRSDIRNDYYRGIRRWLTILRVVRLSLAIKVVYIYVFSVIQMFKSSANKEYFSGNLIPSHLSFIATRNKVTEMVDPWVRHFLVY